MLLASVKQSAENGCPVDYESICMYLMSSATIYDDNEGHWPGLLKLLKENPQLKRYFCDLDPAQEAGLLARFAFQARLFRRDLGMQIPDFRIKLWEPNLLHPQGETFHSKETGVKVACKG